MHVLASTLVASLFVIACSSSSKPPATEPAPGPGSGSTDASHTACSADDDCVVVETACCDHCNGGKAEAYNKQYADAHKPIGCEDTACTLMACGAATAHCEAGQCTVKIEPLK